MRRSRDQGSRQAQRSEGQQGIKGICALGISRQLLAKLLNRDPRFLLLLEGGIDRIDPLQVSGDSENWSGGDTKTGPPCGANH